AETRRAHEVRRTAVSEDGVIFVLAVGNQRIAVLILGQQSVASAIIPAARALAEVAADRPHIADLRAGDSPGRRGQRRKVLANIGVFEQLVEGDDRPDAQAGLVVLDSAQLFDVLDIHHALGRGDVFLHEADEIGASGEDIGLTPTGPEQTGRLLHCAWIRVFEGLHYAFLLSRAASTRSAVKGKLGTRTPTAFGAALATARGSAR